MPMTPKQMIKLLEENGFCEIRQDGSHTTVPYHSKGLKKGIEQKILKDAGLK